MPAPLPDLTDAETWTDDDLDALRAAVLTEQERRYTRDNAASQAEHLAELYSWATGAQDGDEWKPPTGAHDAVPSSRVRKHKGRYWKNDHPGPNPWEPGTLNAPWTEVWPDDKGGFTDKRPTITDGGGEPIVQPWQDATQYKVGDKVSHDGAVWVALIAHTSHAGWAPSEYTHAVWKKV